MQGPKVEVGREGQGGTRNKTTRGGGFGGVISGGDDFETLGADVGWVL